MNKKIIPIGISNNKTLIEENYDFVDKTDFIRQIIEEGSKISILPRLRRFWENTQVVDVALFFSNVPRGMSSGRYFERSREAINGIYI